MTLTIGGLLVSAARIISFTLPRVVSLPTFVTFTSITPVRFCVPAKTSFFSSFSYSSPGNSLEVFLPAGAEVLDVSANHISVQDERIVLYSDSSIDVKYKINQVYNDYLPYLIPVILIIIILIVRFFYFHIFRKNKTTKKDKTESKSQDKLNILKKVLNEREKIIINNLKKSGKIKMSHLRKLTYIPKASFSRHIQELEKKGLINRSGEGKNKFVEIK